MKNRPATRTAVSIPRLSIRARRLIRRGNPNRQTKLRMKIHQQPAAGENKRTIHAGSRLDTLKYSWAKKAFGDAVKANPTNTGVIVLYADENYYDAERLTRYVEEGRDRIAESSAIPGDRIQVVFGGYRAVPQVEIWVVPQGGPMPEFKTDDRSKPAEPAD